jgi:hypothetical protein
MDGNRFSSMAYLIDCGFILDFTLFMFMVYIWGYSASQFFNMFNKTNLNACTVLIFAALSRNNR